MLPRDYLSVVLDDPSFPEPIPAACRLVEARLRAPGRHTQQVFDDETLPAAAGNRMAQRLFEVWKNMRL